MILLIISYSSLKRKCQQSTTKHHGHKMFSSESLQPNLPKAVKLYFIMLTQ